MEKGDRSCFLDRQKMAFQASFEVKGGKSDALIYEAVTLIS